MSNMRPEEIKEAFALFDPQNTGSIQPQAFQSFLDTLGDQELKQAVRIPNHAIDLREFTELMNRYNQDNSKDPEEPYRRAFASINKDGSGQVSAQELRAAIQQFLGTNVLSEADVDEIIREGDVSGDGRITLEEFLKIMQKSEKYHRGEHVL
ncbi:V-type H+-transporting ATPase subunit A [Entomortierella parvispora]|uniref:V-type H+-transporting ATPase subunit A n=1 Tax=Entomortierella parvispora TaxID=205924 RepID=A0A9P3H399_9FUNG|nr:V-type H+-transporting ATPase subunit A [Entomortierella parvispora]